MKNLKKILYISLFLFAFNVHAEEKIITPTNPVKNITSKDIVAYQYCSGECDKKINFKQNLSYARVVAGYYRWVKRKIYFTMYKNRRYRSGYFLLSNNCSVKSGYAHLRADVWRVGQYKPFIIKNKRKSCRVQKIVLN